MHVIYGRHCINVYVTRCSIYNAYYHNSYATLDHTKTYLDVLYSVILLKVEHYRHHLYSLFG